MRKSWFGDGISYFLHEMATKLPTTSDPLLTTNSLLLPTRRSRCRHLFFFRFADFAVGAVLAFGHGRLLGGAGRKKLFVTDTKKQLRPVQGLHGAQGLSELSEG